MNEPTSISPQLFTLRLSRNIWNAHRPWLASAAIMLLLLVFNAAQGLESVKFTVSALIGTTPYLMLSIGIAAYAGATGADSLIARAFVGSPITIVIFAAILGGLSPFCSCGVIPLVAALLSMGVPLAGVMAFWLASPVIDPSMFVLTSGLLGFEFAMAKTLTAISLGLFGGFITLGLVRYGYFSDPLRNTFQSGGCGTSALKQNAVKWAFWQESDRRNKFARELISTALFLFKWLTLAFLLESLMLVYIPAEWIATTLGGTGSLPIATATLVGVPAYLNGYAALPLVSGLIDQGMASGAGLAFLVAGGVTSLPAAIAVFALVKRSVFVTYIVYALTGSFLSGLIFEAWLQ